MGLCGELNPNGKQRFASCFSCKYSEWIAVFETIRKTVSFQSITDSITFFSNKVEPYRFSKTAQIAVVTFPSILTVNGVKRLQSQWTNLGWSSSYCGPPEVFLRQTTNLSREFGVHPQLGLKKKPKGEEFNRHPAQISGPAQSFLFHKVISTLTFFSIVVSLCNSAMTHQRVRNWRGRHCHHLCSEGFLTCFRP